MGLRLQQIPNPLDHLIRLHQTDYVEHVPDNALVSDGNHILLLR